MKKQSNRVANVGWPQPQLPQQQQGQQGQAGGVSPSIASAPFFPPLKLKTISDLFNSKSSFFGLQAPAENIMDSKVLTAAHNFFHNLNTSTFFAGFVMLILNIGSRYIQMDLSESTESVLKYIMKKEVLVFAVAWMGTRNIYYALVITACFSIVADHLMNGKSKYCILPDKFRDIHKIIDTNKDGEISDLEISKALSTLEKAKKQKEENNHVSVLQYHQLFKDDAKNTPISGLTKPATK